MNDREFIKGMDLSTLPEVEALGGRFYDKGGPETAMGILHRHGMNWVRLRLWTDPYSEDRVPYGAGTCDLPRVLVMARRAREMGCRWLLCLHYSDFWADPGKQTVPKSWRWLRLPDLERVVYVYTRSVLDTLARYNLSPDMVAVGNEITNGLLWPLGKAPNFNAIARLVNAGIRAVRESDPYARVMLHLDDGGNNALYRTWFDRYFAAGGADFDVIGLSYYPFWHGPIRELGQNMANLAKRYGKDMLVAETSMGFTLEDYGAWERLNPWERKGMAAKPSLAAKIPWPMTPAGQSVYLHDLGKILRAVPDGKCLGFFWWEPAWLPVPGSGWASEDALRYIGEKGPGGNEWANQALFDYDGQALPALRAIGEL